MSFLTDICHEQHVNITHQYHTRQYCASLTEGLQDKTHFTVLNFFFRIFFKVFQRFNG